VEDLMRAIDGGAPEGEEPDIARLCTTTWVLKDLRTKYCTQTGACVQEFDHYCVWLNTSIGKGNHRQFVCLVVCEWLTQLAHICLIWCMMRELVSYSSFVSWVVDVVTGYPLLTLIFMIQCLTCPWICMLIFHQVRLILQNLTMNEMINMPRYEHFWVTTQVSPGKYQKIFRNPFDKGGAFKNWMDFWWMRQRSQKVHMDMTMTMMQKQCCSHSHGCHGHGHGHCRGH
jgi:hypothetical protein